MIRLSMTLDGKLTVVLGLQPENFDRLLNGEPVKVNLRHLDPDGPPTNLPDIDVVIAATDTDDWRESMKRLGLKEKP